MSGHGEQPTHDPSPGKPPSMDDLVERHADGLYRYAVALCGSRIDAEDLTQQAFLTAQSSLDQLREPAAAGGWLAALVRSAYGRMARKRRPTSCGAIELELDRLPTAIDEPPDDFDPERLRIALAKLPDDYRVVVVGFYFEDCSYKELAARLDIPLGTVMSRLARAKHWLRTQLLDPVAVGESQTKLPRDVHET
ncbi:MAG: sigma-70 family RNA polymerase sigma factor [Pirellulales bacterium]